LATRIAFAATWGYIKYRYMPLAIEELLIATFNRGKLAEICELLRDSPIAIRSLSDHSGITEVEETGRNFAQNAELKAAGYARMTQSFALADDSGLEIEILDRRPGVLSARYGGHDSTFVDKMDLVLREIAESGSDNRHAQFVCAMAIADPDGKIVFAAEGVCRGRIAERPRGNGGFGYDPIFIPDCHDLTFGELSAADKHKISHRARALAEIIPFLRDNTVV